jgi:hypothetical protein
MSGPLGGIRDCTGVRSTLVHTARFHEHRPMGAKPFATDVMGGDRVGAGQAGNPTHVLPEADEPEPSARLRFKSAIVTALCSTAATQSKQ